MIFASVVDDDIQLIDADEASRAPHWLDVVTDPKPDGACERVLARDGDVVRVTWVPVSPQVPDEVSNQQLRLALIEWGISPKLISNAIDAMPEGLAQEKAYTAWWQSNFIRRDHPMIEQFRPMLNLTPAQVDDLFILAATLG